MTILTRLHQGFVEEEGLAPGGVPMQAGVDMDRGGQHQHSRIDGLSEAVLQDSVGTQDEFHGQIILEC